MKRIVRQTLVYCLALSIALPIGWCCWLPTIAFASEDKAAKPACCCCKDETAPKTPAKRPPTPTVPIARCCDPMPATTPETFGDYPNIDLSISMPFVPSADCFANLSLIESANDAPGPSPPLNLLHCVWLC